MKIIEETWLYKNEQNLSNEDLPNIWKEAKTNKINAIDISRNQFTAIDFPTFEMPDIQILELSYNETEIEKLVIDAAIFPNLEYIFAYQSKIKSFEIKGNLPKLKELNLGENKIEKLELSIIDQCPNLEYLVLSGNPFVKNNTLEGVITDNNTLANVKEFLNALKDGTQQNDEIRIILVGNSTSGKTTFYRLVIDLENFDKSKLYSTHEMGTYRVEVDREETSSSAQPKKIYINLWDFGGQGFYHVIHQLFLGKNTIYLLFMTEKYNQNAILPTPIRKKQKDGSIQDTEEEIEHFHHTYWLQTIRDNENIDIEKGEKYSPILLVQNKIDMYPTSIDFNDKCVEEYQINRNDNVFRLSLDKVIESAKNEEENDYTRDFKKFAEKFTELRDKTLIESEIPTIWTLVRNVIRKLSEEKNYLTYQEFYQECFAIYPQDKKPTTINALIGWLKAIGTILYYGDENENLKDIVFIDPIWVSNIIYEILNYDVKNNKGKFNRKHALDTLKGNESLTDIFLNLMKYEKFGLIFQIPNTDEYIAPQYLDANCNNQSSLKLFTNLTKFSFSLYYPDILPNSILTKFISKYGEYVKEYDELCWKNGIVFYHKDKCVFVQKVKKNDKQYIEVKIQDNEQEIAQEIFNTFLEIHKSKKNISISVVENDKDSFVDINKLKNKIENKKTEIESITEKELKVSDFGFLFNEKFNPTKKQEEDMLQHYETFRGKLQEYVETQANDLIQEIRKNYPMNNADKGVFNGYVNEFISRNDNFNFQKWKVKVITFLDNLMYKLNEEHKIKEKLEYKEIKIITTNPDKDMAQIPKIKEKKPETVYVLAVDIVGFSKDTDNNEQFMQFEKLIDLFNKNEDFKKIPQSDSIILLTGDGLALIVKDEKNAIQLFELAYTIAQDKFKGFGLTLALNSGKITWITLEDGSTQAIGQTVNWAFRILGCSLENQILIGENYYNNVISPIQKTTAPFRYLNFERFEAGITKHKEIIIAYKF